MKPEKATRSHAQCDDCPDVAPDANRAASRNHAEVRGHVVRFIVEETTTYAGIRKIGKVELSDKLTVEQRFGKAVRARRMDERWSQQALSDELRKIGVELHQTGVGRLEAGTRGTGLNEAEAISALLGIDRSEWQS